ncbi:MAG: ABC transporter substrate-binding protein [Deltaproteobacteria bacterium]|nr:ABC transporter substrate-binding protein [Deltaproteobacteria bacterium]
MKRNKNFLLSLCLAVALISVSPTEGAEPSQPRKIRAAFTSLSGSQAPPWIAREAGIFRKYGLEVEVIAMPSGVEGMNALIAGEVLFLQIAGGTTVSAAVGGADVTIIATTLGTLVQSLVARPEIEKAEQLRGKSVGISRFGTSIDTGARLALRHFGLIPEKDVAIVQIGAMESIVPAMQGNRVQAGILSYPAITRAKKLGHRVLLDIASLGIPYASTGVTTRAKLIREDPDLVRRYTAAQVEAIARMKKDRNFTMAVMGKYLRASDPELLSETYDIYAQKYLMGVPLPTVEAVRPVLEELAPRNPKAKDQDPRKFFDDSFVRELQASGFIDSLYR